MRNDLIYSTYRNNIKSIPPKCHLEEKGNFKVMTKLTFQKHFLSDKRGTFFWSKKRIII